MRAGAERTSPRLPPSRRVRILAGPSRCLYFPDVGEKRVLLLGEKHTTKGVAPPPGITPTYDVHRWLRELSTVAPECLDVLIESPYGPARPDPTLPVERLARYKFPLTAVDHAFLPCYGTDASRQKACFSQALRYHHLNHHEIRKNWAMTQLFFAYGEDVFARAGLRLQSYYWDKRRILYDFLIGRDAGPGAEELFMGYLRDFAEEVHRGGGAPDPEVSVRVEGCLSLCEEFLPVYKQWLRAAFACCPALDRGRTESVYSDVCALQPQIAPVLWTIPMDLGCLLELFARRPPAELLRGPGGCSGKRFAEKQNVVVISGASHTARYAAFLCRYFGVRALDYSAPSLEQQYVVFAPPFDFFAPRRQS